MLLAELANRRRGAVKANPKQHTVHTTLRLTEQSRHTLLDLAMTMAVTSLSTAALQIATPTSVDVADL